MYHYEFSTPFVDLPLDMCQPATHFCEDLEGKEKGYETRKERTPTLSTPRQQPADKPTHWSFLPETFPDVKLLGRLKSKNGGSFRPVVFSFFRASGTNNRDGAPGVSIPKTRRPDSQQQKMNTLQNFSGLSRSSLTQRLFIKNLLEREVDHTHPHAFSGVLRQLGRR